MKMNNQEIERFEHHVTDMYNILINISTELNTIKVNCDWGGLISEIAKVAQHICY